ncbi:hypothetical protein HKL94_00925 [Candidatus Parcubacteria bacterium]|nr:hypothetical protein [Candidatus Parcubacteria bacterium]
MKISRQSLQHHFEKVLPDIADIADAFTFHAFEIDSIEGDVLDVKVLPNRAADCSTEEGVAVELSAILDLPLRSEPELSYPSASVSTTAREINGLLGADFSSAEIEDVFRRLRLKVKQEGKVYSVVAPAPRNDLVCAADVAEEVGRILGYDRVPATELPPTDAPVDQARFRGIERMKDQLVEKGFTEVSTQSFTKEGDVILANPLDTTRPALRTSLEDTLQKALEQAKRFAPLLFSPRGKPKIFEVGNVFPKNGEYLELRMTERVAEWGDAVGTVDNLSVAKLEDYGKDYTPKRYELGVYHPFSVYPFITRDIACWVPPETDAVALEQILRNQAVADGAMLRIDSLDRFEKEGRISYAFRIVFQSMTRTLTDEEVGRTMEHIKNALISKGYEVR